MTTIVSELSMHDLNNKFYEIMQNESNVEDAAKFIYDSLYDDVAMGFLFEFHHGLKTGLTDLIEGEKEDEDSYKIVNSSECDVFGLSVLKKTQDANCSCPNCERPVSASRFAPHLEKCMGMGRNSSRIASRRIASNSREPTSYAGLPSDDEDDADWSGGSVHSERRKKRIKNSNSRKSNKMHNVNRNTGPHNSDSNDGCATYETMSAIEKKNLLQQLCGVVSEHTKKFCTSMGFYNKWYQVYHFSSDGQSLNNCSTIELMTRPSGIYLNQSRIDLGLFHRYSVGKIEIPIKEEDAAKMDLIFAFKNAPRRFYTCQYSPLIDKHYIYVWILSRHQILNDVSKELAVKSLHQLGLTGDMLVKDSRSCNAKYYDDFIDCVILLLGPKINGVRYAKEEELETFFV
ncbi:unnamed protein product, partial [Leptidea sinapis]